MSIKLFVGCAPNGEDAESQMVLEYTARKYTSMPIDIVWMKIDSDLSSHWGGWDTSLWSTPFSGFRWAIPEYCNFKGQAIYMDSDMIIQEDLTNLWNEPWNDNAVIQSKGGWRFCVAKWNCAHAEQRLMPVTRMKKIPESHSRMCNMFPKFVQEFDRRWNNFDGGNDALKDVKILHYTDMSSQPHFKYALPRLEAADQKHWYDGPIREHRRKDVVELFDKFYNEALNSGMRVADYVPNQIIDYNKLSQKDYSASNGYDVSKGQ